MLLLVSLVVGTFDTIKQFDGKTYSGKYQPTLRYIRIIYTHLLVDRLSKYHPTSLFLQLHINSRE